MEETQERLQVEKEQPIVAAIEKKKEGMPRRKSIAIPKKGEKFKLVKFDFILLQMLKEGRNEYSELSKIFKIADADLKDRINLLKEDGWLSIDGDFFAMRLTIRGVNEYSPKWKSAADNWLGRKEKRRKEKFERSAENKIDASSTIQSTLPIEFLWKELESRHEQILNLPEEKRKEETVDIMDLMKKYGPTDKQKELLNKPSPFIERHIKKENGEIKKQEINEQAQKASEMELKAPAEKAYYNRAISELSKQAADLEVSGDKCELCKSGFIISVKREEHNPKYGHCFCGAPYHRDCYEGVIAGDGKCIKCGRKLGSGSDFKVEEAFKAIRDISY